MDWTIYWFMLPISICVSSVAMLSGIGGAAMFIPIFVVIFPLLGPKYPLAAAAAIESALLTQLFGFSSVFIGYYRKRLIDFESSIPFISVSVPLAILFRLILVLLKATYEMLMLVLCPRDPRPEAAA